MLNVIALVIVHLCVKRWIQSGVEDVLLIWKEGIKSLNQNCLHLFYSLQGEKVHHSSRGTLTRERTTVSASFIHIQVTPPGPGQTNTSVDSKVYDNYKEEVLSPTPWKVSSSSSSGTRELAHLSYVYGIHQRSGYQSVKQRSTVGEMNSCTASFQVLLFSNLQRRHPPLRWGSISIDNKTPGATLKRSDVSELCSCQPSAN